MPRGMMGSVEGKLVCPDDQPTPPEAEQSAPAPGPARISDVTDSMAQPSPGENAASSVPEGWQKLLGGIPVGVLVDWIVQVSAAFGCWHSVTCHESQH